MCSASEVFPKFSCLNPEFTYTLPKYQMVRGGFTTSCRTSSNSTFPARGRQHFRLCDGGAASARSSTARSSPSRDPENYEARSNIMWTATWALNTFVAKGKDTDWEAAYARAGRWARSPTRRTAWTLAAVSMPYYRLILPYGLPRFPQVRRQCLGRRPRPARRTCRSRKRGLPRWKPG